ncbi:uncharacterized protein B0T15DRAFT_495974 [Chaetomium strumarium]|uniref:CST complex subunit STN1 n=1 Tax=Chaetomium strumarium TaxID=1170767 RepID=A0AAJ0GNV6_9PEZI|nr:hypothetical protein B0T15DRAFT_495974 [Chaetomium strumarium]
MTDETAPEVYPQYCFHLSPTINRWCHLQNTDILALKNHRGFEGQDVYFHLNHPIKWVRICGVVVAVDERETRRFYMIDDGSGATLECVVKVAPPAALGTGAAGMNSKSDGDSNTAPVADGPIDVGHVLDIKGSVTTFRTNRQVRAEKIVHLRSTEQEVVFWEKVVQLRRDVLSKPWVLDRREVMKCRKEEEGRSTSHRRKEPGERHSRKQADKAGLRKTRVRDECEENARRGGPESKAEPAKRPKKTTGMESRKTRAHDEGEESSRLEGHGSKSMHESKPEPEKRPRRVTRLESRKTRAHAEGGENSRLGGPESKPQPVKRPRKVTGMERKTPAKPVMRLIPVTGNYDALGL